MTSAAPEPDDSGGGEQLDAFVDAEMEAERTRRDRIDARGAALITTSAGLATLIFAAAGLVTGQDKYTPPRGTIWFLAVTFLAFGGAAFCGLRAGRSAQVEVVTTDQLMDWRNDDDEIWCNTKDNVRWLLTRAKINHIDSLRVSNTARAKWAIRGGAAQLLALGGLLISVGLVMAHEIWPRYAGAFSILTPLP